MNEVRIGLPISQIQLLLALSRRIDELTAECRLLSPGELERVAAPLRSIIKEWDGTLQAFYEADRADP